MNRRREFLVVLGLGPFAATGALAQQVGELRRIGFIYLAMTKPRLEAFRKGMRGYGYVEGKTIAIDWLSADGNVERLPALADEIVRLKPALIVAVGNQAISAVKRATSSIPIVFVLTPDPVATGFVNSLSQPGGNLTGLASVATDLGAKQIEMLKSILPRLSRIALLANPSNNASVLARSTITTAAQAMKLQVALFDAQTLQELERAVAEAKRSRADAAIFAVDGFFTHVRAQIGELALRAKLPTMFTQREHADAGGMVAYGPNIPAQLQRVAHYVDRILKGAKPAELPVEQPSVFEFVINLKTAKALGVTVPQSVLARADVVLQ